MKKLLFVSIILLAATACSTGVSTQVEETDTTTVVMDSVTVDSVAVDSTVIA